MTLFKVSISQFALVISTALLTGCFGIPVPSYTESDTTQEENIRVAAGSTVRFLAMQNSDNQASFPNIRLIAAYGELGRAVEVDRSAEPSANNVVNVSVDDSGFIRERGAIEDGGTSSVDVHASTKCDEERDRCASYAIVSLTHVRGEDAALTIRLDGDWRFLEREYGENPSLSLELCEDDCAEIGDAYLGQYLRPCVFTEFGFRCDDEDEDESEN